MAALELALDLMDGVTSRLVSRLRSRATDNMGSERAQLHPQLRLDEPGPAVSREGQHHPWIGMVRKAPIEVVELTRNPGRGGRVKCEGDGLDGSMGVHSVLLSFVAWLRLGTASTLDGAVV
jgi:hypothetical protein